MRRCATPSLLFLTTAIALLGCGGDTKKTIGERWNAICSEQVREGAGNQYATAADYRLHLEGRQETLKRLREIAPNSELDARQRKALDAFRAQSQLERRFLAEVRYRPISEVALDFEERADVAAARARRAFAAAAAPACGDYPYLR